MNMEAFWESPGASNFLDTAVRKRGDFGIVGVSAPVGLREPLITSLADRAFQIDRVSAQTIDVSSSGAGRTPAPLIANRLPGGRSTRIRSTQEFLQIPNLSDRTFIVHGLDRASWGVWSLFIKGVRREAGDETEILPRIFVTLPSNIPVHEIHAVFGNAAEHRWEGIVDRLDMELWANKTHGLVDDPIEMTARATSIELAGPNPFLLNLLLSLPPEAQINPWDALVSCAEEWLKNKTATWHDGLVDCWEEAIRLDTLVLVKRCDEATFKKRLWRAQTKVVLPILEGIRSRIVRRHRDYLSTIVPWDNPKYPGSHIRNHPDDFDIAELKRVLGHRLSEKEKDLIEFSAYKVRNDLAHMDPIDLDKLEKLLLLQDNIQSPSIEPGWDWPNAGQRLTMLIGSPAAGKSTWASKNCHEHEVISSDEVRSSSQAFQGIGKDGLVFAEVRRRAAALLKSGSNAVIDATHLKSEDRRETRKIIPEWMPIEYVVIDRPLEAKIRDQGWRVDVSESFVKEMHDRFQKAKDDILSGDGDLRVTVREIDL